MILSDCDRVYAPWISCKNMGFNNLDDSREGIGRYLARNPNTCFMADSAGELHAAIASSELYLYEGLGHAAHEEAPDFNRRVFDYLERRL